MAKRRTFSLEGGPLNHNAVTLDEAVADSIEIRVKGSTGSYQKTDIQVDSMTFTVFKWEPANLQVFLDELG